MQHGCMNKGYVKIKRMFPRIVFMGSPNLARTVLEKVSEKYPIYGVITQPDRPAGRGKVLTQPPVKILAEQLGCRIIQPVRLKDPENLDILREWSPDIILVAAFGQILRQNILDLPPLGCVNVHASLLPRWRGAAPIQAAILAGDAVTGVSIMRMDAGIDTGAIYATREIPITDTDDADSLGKKLALLGGDLLVETLPSILNGTAEAKPQLETGATYARMLTKEDGLLDFQCPAKDLSLRVRAFFPWPGTFFMFENQPLKILKAQVLPTINGKAGKRTVIDGKPVIFCGQGALQLEQVQPAGKKPMDGKTFLNGARNWKE